MDIMIAENLPTEVEAVLPEEVRRKSERHELRPGLELWLVRIEDDDLRGDVAQTFLDASVSFVTVDPATVYKY